MTISYYGEGCFKIQVGTVGPIILTDPFSSQSGLTVPRFKFDVLMKTLTPLPLTEQPINQEAVQSIIGPGEYNISSEGGKDTDIVGLANSKESSDKFFKTIYLIKAEAVKICLLGHLSETPEPDILKHLEEIDILIVPAGGKPFIGQETAAKFIKNIGPKIVIPSFYKLPGLKRKADDLKIFLEEANHAKTGLPIQEKLAIKKKDLAEIKKTEIAVLKI